jgi:hypothetical protein
MLKLVEASQGGTLTDLSARLAGRRGSLLVQTAGLTVHIEQMSLAAAKAVAESESRASAHAS